LAAGGEVSGFRERRWKTVQQMKPGDYLLCYLTGISRWIGVLEVVSEPFRDTTPIWKDEAFPTRVRVRPVATLSPETAVPVFELRDELTVFRDLKNSNAWTGHFRGHRLRWLVWRRRYQIRVRACHDRRQAARPWRSQSMAAALGAGWPRPNAGANPESHLCPVPPRQSPSVPGEPFGSP
jgi:predicted RNA-binding protein